MLARVSLGPGPGVAWGLFRGQGGKNSPVSPRELVNRWDMLVMGVQCSAVQYMLCIIMRVGEILPEGNPEGSGDISLYISTLVTKQTFSITSTCEFFLISGLLSRGDLIYFCILSAGRQLIFSCCQFENSVLEASKVQ